MLNLMDFHKDNLKAGRDAAPNSVLGKARASGGELTTYNASGMCVTTPAPDLADGWYVPFGKEWREDKYMSDPPGWNVPEIPGTVLLPVEETMSALRRVITCVSRKNGDPERYKGICFHFGPHGLRLVATDNIRMATATVCAEGLESIPEGKYIIPTKALEVVMRGKRPTVFRFGLRLRENAECWCAIGDVLLQTDYVRVFCPLQAGEFPDYEFILRKFNVNAYLLVSRSELVSALTELKPYWGDKSEDGHYGGCVFISPLPSEFSVNPWPLSVSARHSVGGEKVITLDACFVHACDVPDCTVIMPHHDKSGDAREDAMLISAPFLLDDLKAREGEQVVLGFGKRHEPCVLLSADDCREEGQC